jgi:hypothetical protein
MQNWMPSFFGVCVYTYDDCTDDSRFGQPGPQTASTGSDAAVAVEGRDAGCADVAAVAIGSPPAAATEAERVDDAAGRGAVVARRQQQQQEDERCDPTNPADVAEA